MNTKFKYIFSTAALLLSVGFTSCTGDLDVKPIDPNLNTKENTSPESAFNKCYAHIAMAGNGGANGVAMLMVSMVEPVVTYVSYSIHRS